MSVCWRACCASPAIRPSSLRPIRTQVCDLHRKNRYSLILLDLQMPGMDGFQVMEGLKEIEEDGYLPVLVITAQPDHKLRRSASRRQGFRQQAVRSGRAARARSQHPGSASVAPGNEELQQRAGGDGPGTGGKPRGDSSQEPGGAQERASRNWPWRRKLRKACCPASCPSLRIFASMRLTVPRAMWEGISTISCN